MNAFVEHIEQWLLGLGLPETWSNGVSIGLGLIVLTLLAWATNLVAKGIILRFVKAAVRRSRVEWDDVLVDTGVFTRLSHLAPALVINTFAPGVLGRSDKVLAGVEDAVSLYLICIWLGVLFAVLNAVQLITKQKSQTRGVPIKGFIQAVDLGQSDGAGGRLD